MTLFDRIKTRGEEKGYSIAKIEELAGLSPNSLYKWKTQTPKIDKLKSIADLLDVSTDYLLGRTDKKHYYDLTEKDERDIQKDLENMIADLKNSGPLAFSKDGVEMSEATQEALIISLENALRIAKIEAKKKFTPKKYRDE